MRIQAAKATTLSARFWQEARSHRLVVPRCNTSGQYFFPPERCIPGTFSTDWAYVESSGTGKVATFTVVHRAPSEGFEVPYVLAVVTVTEGWNYLTNIVECRPDDVFIGMPVEVTFQEIEGATLPVFKPISSRGAGRNEH